VSILPAMPSRPGAATGVDLGELRVLDGPNRFFVRPAVKLEFAGEQPGAAAAIAHDAGAWVADLHGALGMPAPRRTFRSSADGLRAIVAFPWRRRASSQAIAAAAARLALGQSTRGREVAQLRAMAPGPLPSVPAPRIPVVAVTGTNGKSTTTRLIAHVLSGAGRAVGMTNSDGIYLRGELVEEGDWTGFGGAGRVLAEPGVEVAVLETARGGILLRGIGYDHNDVAVVTNVSADHLGLQGIDTLDELAEVKAAVVRVTRRGGWAVLNADDPRVWRMRRETKASWYPFTLDPGSPAIAAALGRGGRAAVLEKGWIVLRAPGMRAVRLVAAAELPVTFGGLSRYNVANALAAAAAADAIGINRSLIREGLLTFAQDAAANPGRMNLFERNGTLALVDFAHNEAGLAGLLEVCRSLANGERSGDDGVGPGRVRLALGTAGDRTDQILRNLGELAGRGADEVVICEKRRYLRGRELEAMNELLRDGLRRGGYARPVPAFPTELEALQALLRRSRPGDVAAVMSHVERSEIFAWLASRRFAPVGVDRVRQLTGA
jgi:cyanophycin synthetase